MEHIGSASCDSYVRIRFDQEIKSIRKTLVSIQKQSIFFARLISTFLNTCIISYSELKSLLMFQVGDPVFFQAFVFV